MTLTLRTAGAVLCLFTLATSHASAQGTRAEELERQRTPRNGFFVRFGFHEKPVGAGIGVGGGYRHDLFGRRARIVTEAGLSLRNYQLLRADVALPSLARNRAELGVEATYRHNPQQDFYGTGPESLEADRVTYRIDSTAVVARALVRPRSWFTAGVHAGRLAPSIGDGATRASPR